MVALHHLALSSPEKKRPIRASRGQCVAQKLSPRTQRCLPRGGSCWSPYRPGLSDRSRLGPGSVASDDPSAHCIPGWDQAPVRDVWRCDMPHPSLPSLISLSPRANRMPVNSLEKDILNLLVVVKAIRANPAVWSWPNLAVSRRGCQRPQRSWTMPISKPRAAGPWRSLGDHPRLQQRSARYFTGTVCSSPLERLSVLR